MDWVDKAWDVLSKLPKVLNEYSTFSYPLLLVLLVAGLIPFGLHFYRTRRRRPGLSTVQLLVAGAVAFVALSGMFLRWVGDQQQKRSDKEFVQKHRIPAGGHGLFVCDFSLPREATADEQQRYLSQMDRLRETLTEVLFENLPLGFPQPMIKPLSTQESPWRHGIGQENFATVISELNATEILWGIVDPGNREAKAFLGLSGQVAQDLDRIIPLENFPLDEDPAEIYQFGAGYYRLLGLVTLAMALETFRSAQGAPSEERRALYLEAAQRFASARNAVNNATTDPMLIRTVFSPKVDQLIAIATREAEVRP